MASNRDYESGFSLLELIIVLMVMVSLLAIAWPNLQRPLRRTSLSEAASTLRSAIDDSRYQAITSGTPVFVLLQQGKEMVRSGSFDSFMSDEVDIASTVTSLEPATIKQPSARALQVESPSSIRTWTLPTSVVISDVRWTLEPPTDEFGVSESTSDSFIDGTSGQIWWLPLVATGQGRDAAIVLLDTSINEEITVTFASATGALEFVR